MAHLIDKDDLVAKIDKFVYGANLEADIASTGECFNEEVANVKYKLCKQIKDEIDTLEVIDPYEQIVQYDSIKAGIQAHAEIYSFNIESKLFNQLTKEQQKLWRKEIEQACISGGEMGVELARDIRYKENREVKEVDLDEEADNYWGTLTSDVRNSIYLNDFYKIAKHFFELGLAQKGEEVDLEKDVRQILSLYYEGIKHYEDVIKKEREENGGSDLAIKIMDGVVDARELSIQYVIDKLKAQKGEEV